MSGTPMPADKCPWCGKDADSVETFHGARSCYHPFHNGPLIDIWQHDETGRIVELPAGSPSPGKRYYRVRGMGGRVSVVGKGNEARVVFTPDAPAPADDASGAEAMREALRGWARFCAKWPAKECDDGSGYYSEADHDQAACCADTLRVLALPRPARGDGDWWARHVLEATDLAALKSIAEGWPMSRPAPRDAARDAIAAERDRCAALLRQMAIARGDLDERLVLQHAARCVEKCPACEGCGMDADGAPCKSCAETAT